MDRIWQWTWDRYGFRYSWAVWAIGVPLLLQVYLLFAIVIVAFEKSDHYAEAAAVALVATLVHQYVVILPGLGRIRLVERWAEGREVDRKSALDATYSMTRGAVVRAVVANAVVAGLLGVVVGMIAGASTARLLQYGILGAAGLIGTQLITVHSFWE